MLAWRIRIPPSTQIGFDERSPDFVNETTTDLLMKKEEYEARKQECEQAGKGGRLGFDIQKPLIIRADYSTFLVLERSK